MLARIRSLEGKSPSAIAILDGRGLECPGRASRELDDAEADIRRALKEFREQRRQGPRNIHELLGIVEKSYLT